MRADARVVVIGGGVAGTSIAYHLARLGWREILLVEQHDLTEGTTWHSAGFVGQGVSGDSAKKRSRWNASSATAVSARSAA